MKTLIDKYQSKLNKLKTEQRKQPADHPYFHYLSGRIHEVQDTLIMLKAQRSGFQTRLMVSKGEKYLV